MVLDKKSQSKHAKRFSKTLDFMDRRIDPASRILKLAAATPFSTEMKKHGYSSQCTKLETDLDFCFDDVMVDDYDVVVAVEIIERLVAPLNILCKIKAPELIAVVPLNLWFKKAYWNKNDPWDRHYHEFEPCQFEMLLTKAGWRIEYSEFWKSTSSKFGLRSLLRKFTPRYYVVHCKRIKGY